MALHLNKLESPLSKDIMCQGLVHCSGEVKKMTARRLKGDPNLIPQSICVFKDGVQKDRKLLQISVSK